ncbi:MAG: DUF1847 domain-containing protein [Polyangiaceae bacterium]|nr:DUF1847 domain-containing protein [Polyangiaceae bacterium]
MRLAAPVFGSRVAPNFTYADCLVLGLVEQGRLVELRPLDTKSLTDDERIRLLEKHEVSVLVCGGIDHELLAELRCRGIEVIHNVAGEMQDVLALLAQGSLRSGHGITYRPGLGSAEPHPTRIVDGAMSRSSDSRPDQRDAVPVGRAKLDCIDCGDRVCLRGLACRAYSGPKVFAPVAPLLHQLMTAALDISAEPERVLCRMAELAYFCVEMHYEHVGLAFCADLLAESETVTRLLRRFVRVTPVCCRVGGQWQEEDPEGGPTCNPFAMAHMLNAAKTDLNVAVGLSIGCDVVFGQLSHAPVTTLFVKDKLLANNPVSACHSRYVLERILASP